MANTGRLPRAVAIYLAAIVAPALVLLYLGLQSLDRRRETVRALELSNRRLSEERLAAEIESRVRRTLQACLDLPNDPCRPAAQHRFLMDNGEVLSPRLHAPPPRNPDGLPAIFELAEDHELRQGLVADAASEYEHAIELATSPPVKALALSRLARCYARLGRTDAARRAWTELMQKYADLYDPSHRPYSLLARLELGRTEGLDRELIAGRWDLSAEQFDYFFSRLHQNPPAGNSFDFGRELQEHFRHVGPLRPGEIYSATLPSWRVYYGLTPGASTRLAGVALNSDWVHRTLAPQVRREFGIPEHWPEIDRSGLWTYGGVTLLVVGTLVLGIILLLRDVSRDFAANQLRADFVSGVSHELKTPLTLIRLYAETLLHGHDFEPAERRGFYEIIARESERLHHLIDKVLNFSRIERGEKDYNLQPGDLTSAVRSTVEAYRHFLERGGFTVEAAFEPAVPAVRFDENAVAQAIINLLDNAVKYSGDAKFVGIRLGASDSQVYFEIEDHGIGIPPADQQRIFDKFYRATPASGSGGYGLGLFLVRHVMRAHGGEVQVESRPGHGSRFRLVFPVMA